jgi:hypothetical protein
MAREGEDPLRAEDRAVLRANYTGDETGRPYDIEAIKNKNIPGNSSQVTRLSFKFVPLLSDLFVVNTFEKNYWGYVDTEIGCSPSVVFNAMNGLPTLTMTISDFPTSAWSGQCEPFTVAVTNTGDSHLRGFVIVLDHPDMFVCRSRKQGRVIRMEGIVLVQYLESVAVDEVVTLPFIFKAGAPGIQTVHFYVAVVGVRCAFDVRRVAVRNSATVEWGAAVAKANDTGDFVFHCRVTAEVDGVEVVGLINRRNTFMKTVSLAQGQVLARGGLARSWGSARVTRESGQRSGGRGCLEQRHSASCTRCRA